MASLIHHDGNDETDDMEETNGVIRYSCKCWKILASLGYVTSNFIAINNEDFKTLKGMVNFYLRY